MSEESKERLMHTYTEFYRSLNDLNNTIYGSTDLSGFVSKHPDNPRIEEAEEQLFLFRRFVKSAEKRCYKSDTGIGEHHKLRGQIESALSFIKYWRKELMREKYLEQIK